MSHNIEYNNLLDKLKNLSERRREVLNELLQGNTDDKIGEKLDISVATVRKHIQSISQYFGIEGEPGHRRNRRKKLKQIFEQYNLTDASIADNIHELTFVEEVADINIGISYLSGALPLDSPLYIRRNLADDKCEKTLETVEANSIKLPLINIRGAQFTGKSSLLIRLQDYAETKLNHVAAFIDLNSDILEPELFEDLDKFLKQFTSLVIQRFIKSREFPQECKQEIFRSKENFGHADLVDNWLRDNWLEHVSSGVNCTNCLEKFLKPINKPKTLFVDGLEIIANKKIEFPFLTLLRNWTQSKMTKTERDNNVFWFSIVTIYSTRIQDSFISPLENVGRKVSLPELNQKQLSILAHKYGLDWSPVDYNIVLLKELIGGQPMLANWAFQKISIEKISVEALKNQVAEFELTNDTVISFLFKSIKNLDNDRESLNFIKNLLEGRKNKPSLENYKLDKLERSGFIKFEANQWQISCGLYRELYRQYFNRYFFKFIKK